MQLEVRGGGTESKKILVIYQEQKQFINCYTFFYTIENQSSQLLSSSCETHRTCHFIHLKGNYVPNLAFLPVCCSVKNLTIDIWNWVMAWEKLMVSSWRNFTVKLHGCEGSLMIAAIPLPPSHPHSPTYTKRKVTPSPTRKWGPLSGARYISK